MALCSLSTGIRATPLACTRSITRGPAATRVSLLAKATVLPASMAARVGSRPTAPTMADSTRSASGREATARAPSGPQRISGPFPAFMTAFSLAAAVWSLTDTTTGRKRRICSASSSTFWPAARATTRNSSVCSVTTDRVLWPMEPVEPRMARRFIIFPNQRNYFIITQSGANCKIYAPALSFAHPGNRMPFQHPPS